MDKDQKLYEYILLKKGDANISFAELSRLLKRLGFEERIRGDHHIFTRTGVDEILNLQPKKAKAKDYQVRQVRYIILRYDLQVGEA